jgi:hypothetical protein
VGKKIEYSEHKSFNKGICVTSNGINSGGLVVYLRNVTDQHVRKIVTAIAEIIWTATEHRTAKGAKLCWYFTLLTSEFKVVECKFYNGFE